MSRQSTISLPLSERTPSQMSNGRLSWEIVGVGRRSSRLCPTGSVASQPSSLTPPSGRAKALVRGEEDVDPGAVDLSNPAVRLG